MADGETPALSDKEKRIGNLFFIAAVLFAATGVVNWVTGGFSALVVVWFAVGVVFVSQAASVRQGKMSDKINK